MFTLGLDGLDITINTDVKLEQNHYVFKNQTGKEIGNLVAVKNGYKLHIYDKFISVMEKKNQK